MVISAAFVMFKIYFINFNLSEKNYILRIKSGDSVSSISKRLFEDKIYPYQKISFLTIRLLTLNKTIKSGEYEIKKNENLIHLISKIRNNKQYYRKITFVEGKMMISYIDQINKAYGLMGEIDIKIPEGYFMPGTYFYLYGESKNSILKRGNLEMLNFVNKEFDKIKDKPSFYLKNINDIISLASIVEKETGLSGERKTVASVFYNRLKINMRLQSDPTTIYEITQGKFELNRPLTYNDLTIRGNYNTYRRHGIPIGPIASPGKKSIMAVLNPSSTSYLFFVANGSGGHTFADTFLDHKKNIKYYRDFLNKKYE